MLTRALALAESGEERLEDVTTLLLRSLAPPLEHFDGGALAGLRQLRVLSLSNNGLRSLQGFHQLCCLEELNVNFNALDASGLAPLSSCASLAKLYCSNNRVESAHFASDLRALRTLCLYGNEIRPPLSAVCAALKDLKIVELDLLGNECSAEGGYRAQLVGALGSLEALDGEAVGDLDRDLARMWRASASSGGATAPGGAEVDGHGPPTAAEDGPAAAAREELRDWAARLLQTTAPPIAESLGPNRTEPANAVGGRGLVGRLRRRARAFAAGAKADDWCEDICDRARVEESAKGICDREPLDESAEGIFSRARLGEGVDGCGVWEILERVLSLAQFLRDEREALSAAVRAGAAGGDASEMATLRMENANMYALQSENRQLRMRVAALEQRMAADVAADPEDGDGLDEEILGLLRRNERGLRDIRRAIEEESGAGDKERGDPAAEEEARGQPFGENRCIDPLADIECTQPAPRKTDAAADPASDGSVKGLLREREERARRAKEGR